MLLCGLCGVVKDNTGSMGSYIAQVQKNIANIVKTIVASEKADVVFGLVRYRDFTVLIHSHHHYPVHPYAC